ncbi:L-ascorbate 6-phosphate lactonase [Paenibacillus sp. 1_12]|uniref:MBL fold metallo-hydrolase n=1 Tax=Paenibacillus sp. 1_12 TaxID=1566278 RepID=UPI0008E675F1|nr:MBL fold metallo-hydrolase [Paenibacillus sp. 1_12]SFL57984.1 L-ascorbate 6-phosphate lactonase [Paenibacillus sp. 1_12]
MPLFAKIRDTVLAEGQMAVAWLGQSGYLLKIYPATYLIVDPYLSDYCEHQLGILFKRLMPSPITSEELDELGLSGYLMTHHHEDHFDPHTIQKLQATTLPFYTTPTTITSLLELGIPSERCFPLTDGSHYEIGSIAITGTFADHGDLAPDAVGIMLKIHDKVIFHTGDTCLNEAQYVKLQEQYDIDFLIVPINGKYGNMDHVDAAQAVRILQPRAVTPSHFWMLPGNSGGDITAFMEEVGQTVPDTQVLLFQCGEVLIV